MSHVHYTPYPGVEKGLGSIPWIESAGSGSVKASLFYYGAVPWRAEHLLGARIFTTQKRRDVNPKVLWTIRAPGRGSTVKIRATRLDGSGSFGATYPSAGYDYPSYVQVPHPGCWRVTVSSGRLVGRFVFAAINL
jgi:hypothetical protein